MSEREMEKNIQKKKCTDDPEIHELLIEIVSCNNCYHYWLDVLKDEDNPKLLREYQARADYALRSGAESLALVLKLLLLDIGYIDVGGGRYKRE